MKSFKPNSETNNKSKAAIMKTYILLTVMAVTLNLQAQYRFNKKVAQIEMSNKNVVHKSLSIEDIAAKSLAPSQKFTDISLVQFPKEKLSLRASKSWKITPRRPSMPGLSFRFDGKYNPYYFTLIAPHIHTAATRSGELYRTYSGRLVFNGHKGGEYRMKISLVNDDFPGSIFNPEQYMLIQLGDREIRTTLNEVRNREVNVFFTTQNAGQITIGISGVNPGRERASYLSLSAIQIDKI